jgi:hypothetical protein
MEFVETEKIGVVEYSFARKKSGWTAGISKFVQVWFHCNYAVIPKSLRKLKPPREAEKWMWSEVWHMSKWITYSDPYSRQRFRFRMWRRTQIAPGKWTEEENKPPEETNEEKKEQGENDNTQDGEAATAPDQEQKSGGGVEGGGGEGSAAQDSPGANNPDESNDAAGPAPPTEPPESAVPPVIRTPAAPSSPPPDFETAENIAKADAVVRDPDSPTA